MFAGDSEEERAERHAQHLARARDPSDLTEMLSEQRMRTNGRKEAAEGDRKGS